LNQIVGKNPVSGFGAGIKETGFLLQSKVWIKYFGKKPGFWFSHGV